MKLAIGVKAFIINDEKKVLVLREGKYLEGTNEGKWDVPGGRINSEETLFEGLKREVAEECGLTIEMGNLLHVQENFPKINGEDFHVVRIFYSAKYIAGEVRLSGDHNAYEWVSPDSLEDKDFVQDVKKVILSLL